MKRVDWHVAMFAASCGISGLRLYALGDCVLGFALLLSSIYFLIHAKDA